MDYLLIFGAEYLIFLSPILTALYIWRMPKETRNHLLIFFVVSLPLTYGAGLVARELYFNPRPFVVGGFEPLVPHAADNGFPSDHMLLASALAAGSIWSKRSFALTMWLIAGLVALSRVLVGVHHAVDVLASIFIALVPAGVVRVFLNRYSSVIIPTSQPSHDRE